MKQIWKGRKGTHAEAYATDAGLKPLRYISERKSRSEASATATGKGKSAEFPPAFAWGKRKGQAALAGVPICWVGQTAIGDVEQAGNKSA